MLDGRRTSPATVELVKVLESASGSQAVVSVTIHEGRNRQVRRMCEAVGHPVVRLKRVRIGPITDRDIRPGEFRDLTPKEIAALKSAAERLTEAARVSGLPESGSAAEHPANPYRNRRRTRLATALLLTDRIGRR
jgi:hypothetical protein